MSLTPFKIRAISVLSALFLLFFLSVTLRAEQTKGDKAEAIKKYAFYTVIRGETPFSVAKKFNLTVEDFFIFNPQSKQGLHEGDRVRIPAPFTIFQGNDKVNKAPQRVQYVVGRRETLYSIAKMFNTSQEEILKINPSVKGNLTNGTVLIIPALVGTNFEPQITEQVLPPSREYTLAKGDNYFQLQQRYGVFQSELELLNPSLKEGFKLGMVIKLPLKNSPDVSTAKNEIQQAQKETVKSDKQPVIAVQPPVPPNLNKTFEIGIYLPFCQDFNDSARMALHSNSFFEFYSGVLLATGKLSEEGMKLKLFAYDTYHDSDVVTNLVKKPEFLSLDLIIGPVYPNDQKVVAALSYKNRIPMVSPLSSDSRFVSTTPGYYLINPGKRLRLSTTAEYISANFAGQNIILLNHGTNSGEERFLFDRLTQKLGGNKIIQYNILTGEATGLEELLKDDLQNVFVLAEGSEANVSVAMTRLNTLSKSHKLLVVGLQEYTKMQSINIEYLHNTNLHYLAPYFIDYGSSKVNSFIEKYRLSFGSEPTQYSFQGYDIALHFIALLAKSGKNFPATNPNPGVDLLQADYSFQKPSELGGYVNRTLYVIEYTNDYEVKTVEKLRGSVASDHGDGKGSEKSGLEL